MGFEAIAPFVILFIGIFAAYFACRVGAKRDNPYIGGYVTAAFFAITLYSVYLLWIQRDLFPIEFGLIEGLTHLRVDALSLLLAFVVLTMGFLVSIYSIKYMDRDTRLEVYYPLLLSLAAGSIGIGFAADMFSLYVFFELMAISSYVLVAFRVRQRETVEAGFKYIILSGIGSLIAIFGISIVFAQTGGQLDFVIVREALAGLTGASLYAAYVAVFMIIIGFGVKVSIVPLHTWLPDAYPAAPVAITAMLAIKPGLVALIKCISVFPPEQIPYGLILAIFAVITMFTANFMALMQRNLKRLLAYSSIAHAGYMLLGIGLGLQYGVLIGLTGGLFHIMTHAFMKGLAFLCAGAIIYTLAKKIGERKSADLDEMRGIGHYMPITCLSLSIAGLALSGAPPLSGFMSEWLIFRAGLEVMPVIGAWGLFFASAAILNSFLSLGYYLPLIRTLFLTPTEEKKFEGIREVSGVILIPILIMVAITVLLGIFPQMGLEIAHPAAEMLYEISGGGR